MLLSELELKPLLDLGMRLGEGSGAALAVPVLRAALACHAGMATFARGRRRQQVALEHLLCRQVRGHTNRNECAGARATRDPSSVARMRDRSSSRAA